MMAMMRCTSRTSWRLALTATAVASAAAACSGGGHGHARQRGEPARSPAGLRSSPADDPRGPTRRLTGTTLKGTTGLRFMIAGDPPILLDADRNTTHRIETPAKAPSAVGHVQRVGSATVMQSICDRCATSDIYLLDREATGTKPIAVGTDFVPSADERGIWVWRERGDRRCSVRQIWLNGRIRTAERDDRCDRVLFADTPSGLLLAGQEEGSEAIIERHEDGQEIFREVAVNAVAGRQVLSDQVTGRSFTLTDTTTGAQTEIPKPTSIGTPSPGLLAPDGRMLAISFDHPAFPGPRQRMDTWVLDLSSRGWRHAPAMPVNASLKASGMAWTPDGRLVLLGRFDGVGDVLALWRPGDARWAIRKIRLPRYGADDFAVLPNR